MMHVGGYLEYRGGVQYHGGYHEYRGGYHDAHGDIMSNVGGGGDTILCILSTAGLYHDTCGGYHEYHGECSVPWEYSNNKRFPPTVLMISPRY